MKAYIRALEREQEAWRALDGLLPGMSGCSPALWADWMEAVARLNVEVARCTHIHQLEVMAAAPAQRRANQRRSRPAHT